MSESVHTIIIQLHTVPRLMAGALPCHCDAATTKASLPWRRPVSHFPDRTNASHMGSAESGLAWLGVLPDKSRDRSDWRCPDALLPG
jgi:hypothetical protein